jgi:hypothetical protein
MAVDLSTLPEWHLEILRWFEDHEGEYFATRPSKVGTEVRITEDQPGIRKPAGTPYAVSVIQTHAGAYPDQDPVGIGGESWLYRYHQEGSGASEIAHPEARPRNRGLLSCIDDAVPVGVIIPDPRNGGRGYKVLGLAAVLSFREGFFALAGPVRLGALGQAGARARTTFEVIPFPKFDATSAQDDRKTVVREVVQRQGQPAFRQVLMAAYEGSCAFSRYDAPDALEAAHIRPYKGPQTNHPQNGLLLRADLHDLFDLGLVAVDVNSMKLLLADHLSGTKYEPLDGTRMFIPKRVELQPSAEALARHREHSLVAS